MKGGTNGVRSIWINWNESLAHLLGLHELWGVRLSAGHGRSMNKPADRLSSARWSWGSIALTPTMPTPMGGAKRLLALREFASRDEVVLATKVFFEMGPGPNDRGLSRKHILSSIDASLKRLGTDYVDLYQINRWDYDTPIEETLEALNDVVRAGKARYIGASAMYAWQFAKALYISDLHGWRRFVSMQPHYNLIYREEERDMLPLCQDQKIAVIPYAPLAKGRLARKPSKERNETLRAQTDDVGKRLYTEEDLQIAQRVSEVAEARSLPMAQVALAWILSKPVVTAPIIGATKPHHLDDAVAALSVQLTPDEIRHVEEAYQPHLVLGYA
jgi:aryl-alcohol dehydrogenase-like predicted oxidoreductase